MRRLRRSGDVIIIAVPIHVDRATDAVRNLELNMLRALPNHQKIKTIVEFLRTGPKTKAEVAAKCGVVNCQVHTVAYPLQTLVGRGWIHYDLQTRRYMLQLAFFA
jgi:hypothetical protein